MDWFKIEKVVCQDCILSPCSLNLYPEYITWSVMLNDSQAGIKIARRNINKLRYADDTTIMADSEEEVKNLLMKVKEESKKAGLKLSIQKTILASVPITSWQISSVQSLSRVWLFVTPWTTARQASLSITNSQSLPKLMSIESMMPSNHLILCRPLLLLLSIYPSIRVFSNKSALCIRWPKYWSFRWGKNGNSDSLYFLGLQSHCGWWL